jgi:hypothetical protein
MPCRRSASATKPLPFIASTNSLSTRAAVSPRDFRQPIARRITIKRPGSRRRPGSQPASASGCCFTPAALPPPGARETWSRAMLARNSSRCCSAQIREGARCVALHLCRLVQGQGMTHAGNKGFDVVTVSIGAATAWPGDPSSKWRGTLAPLAVADEALYRTKRGGRNQIQRAEDAPAGKPTDPPYV